MLSENAAAHHYRPSHNPDFVRRVKAKRAEERSRLEQVARAEARAKIAAEKDAIRAAIRKAREAIQKAKDEAEQRTLNSNMMIDEIIKHVAALHGLTAEQIVSKSRTVVVMQARIEALVTINELRPDLSSTQVGRAFNRHHTSILHAWWKYANKSRRSSPKQEGQPR